MTRLRFLTAGESHGPALVGILDGLPASLQLIGPPWSELELLRFSRGYEAITATAEWRSLEPARPAVRVAAAQLPVP